MSDGRMDGQMGGWMSDGRVDGWMDEWREIDGEMRW